MAAAASDSAAWAGVEGALIAQESLVEAGAGVAVVALRVAKADEVVCVVMGARAAVSGLVRH